MFDGERPSTPTQKDVILAWLGVFAENLHTAFPARVETYDAAKQVADLTPLVRHAVLQPDGSSLYEDMPVLPNVPVVFPRMGLWFVSMPIARGDTMLVVCCESAIGTWRTGDGATVQHPGDLRRFDLSHAVAIPGLGAASAVLAVDQHSGSIDAAMVLGKQGGATVAIKPDGTVTIAQGSTLVAQIDPDGTVNLGAASGAAFVALASLVDAQLTALDAMFGAWVTVPNDGGAALKALWTTLHGTGWPHATTATKVKAT